MIEGKALKRSQDEYSVVEEYVLNAKLKDINPMFFGHVKHFPGKTDGPENGILLWSDTF